MSLWTSVRDTARGLIGAAAPIVGASIGGPIGGVFGKALGAAIQPTSFIGGPPPAMPGSGGDGGMVPTAAGGVVTRGAIAIGRWLIGARGIARNATGKIVGVMRGTSLFRNKRVIALAKQIGIEGAAVALGITVAEVAEMFVAETGKRRRARGISGRDIRCTRRTLGKIRSVQRMIGLARPAARRGPAKTIVRCD